MTLLGQKIKSLGFSFSGSIRMKLGRLISTARHTICVSCHVAIVSPGPTWTIQIVDQKTSKLYGLTISESIQSTLGRRKLTEALVIFAPCSRCEAWTLTDGRRRRLDSFMTTLPPPHLYRPDIVIDRFVIGRFLLCRRWKVAVPCRVFTTSNRYLMLSSKDVAPYAYIDSVIVGFTTYSYFKRY